MNTQIKDSDIRLFYTCTVDSNVSISEQAVPALDNRRQNGSNNNIREDVLCVIANISM